jgi:hypothetical protein
VVELILAIGLLLTIAYAVPQPSRTDSWYAPISSKFEFMCVWF